MFYCYYILKFCICEIQIQIQTFLKGKFFGSNYQLLLDLYTYTYEV